MGANAYSLARSLRAGHRAIALNSAVAGTSARAVHSSKAMGERAQGGEGDMVIWDERLETGIAAVDQQHRRLVEIINALGKLLSGDAGREEKGRLLQLKLSEIMNYVQYHFSFEIGLMRECRLSTTLMTIHEEAHKAEHAEFTRRVTEVAAEAGERAIEVMAEMLDFLSKWLHEHIMGTDLQMAAEINVAKARERELGRESRKAWGLPPADHAHTLDMLPGGVYSWRIHRNGARGFEYANRTFCELLDIEIETLRIDHRVVLSAVHQQDLRSLSRQSVISARKFLPFRWQGRVAVGGETRRISVHAVPQRLEDGSSRWIGLVTDITDCLPVEKGKKALREMPSNAGSGGVAHARDVTPEGRYRACTGCQSVRDMHEHTGLDVRYSIGELEQANALRDDLVTALERDQFQIALQPQIDSMGNVVGAEALLRWQHPERGLVPPGKFIAALEVTGIIIPVGEWVIEMACRQLKEWSKTASLSRLTLSVNVSARQFHDEKFVEKVRSEIARQGINPYRLKLELTESMLMRGSESAIRGMETLRAIGVQLSLDDFGTGYSSLQYLRYLPIDQIKIDRSFVRNIGSDGSARAILHSIIDLADTLGLDMIAEGVETEEQKRLLVNAGCKCFQGYLVGRPMPVEQFEACVREGV